MILIYHKIEFFILFNIKLQLFNLWNKFYLSFDKFIITFNAFTSFQKYIIVKKHIKTSKKSVMQKVILMYNREKKLIDNLKSK